MAITTKALGRSYLSDEELIKLQTRLEGYFAQPYDDGARLPTIGIGLNIGASDTNLDGAFVLVLNQKRGVCC